MIIYEIGLPRCRLVVRLSETFRLFTAFIPRVFRINIPFSEVSDRSRYPLFDSHTILQFSLQYARVSALKNTNSCAIDFLIDLRSVFELSSMYELITHRSNLYFLSFDELDSAVSPTPSQDFENYQ